MSEATYRQVALEDPEGKWELVCGRLREKPIRSTEHNDVQCELERTLIAWRRQTGGSYVETLSTGGIIRPAALPNVTVDLDRLFD